MLNEQLRNHRDSRAFSLIELIVVTVVLGIIGTVVVTAIIGATRATSVGEERVNAVNDLQRGLERVGRELRAASPLILDASGDYEDSIGAQVVRNNQRITYRYYLTDSDDGESIELREDVTRRDLTGNLIESQQGLFIADIANIETGTPLFTYYVRDDETGQITEIDCSSLSNTACRDRHATANQVKLTLEKLLPDQDPIRTETAINIRNTRVGGTD